MRLDDGPARRAPAHPPASDELCDHVCLVFAAWTLGCHLMLALSGNLRLLLLIFVAALPLLHRLWRCRPAAEPGLSWSDRSGEPTAASRVRRWAPVAVAAGLLASLPFYRDYLWAWWLFFAFLLFSFCENAFQRREITPSRPVAAHPRWLWGLAIGAAALALVAHRSDADDALYVSMAVAAADQPDQPLLIEDTLHGIPGVPLHLSLYRLHSYELLNGALSFLTGVPAIYCFHWISAALGAFLVPLAYARLFRILTPSAWLLSVVVVIALLVGVGDTHRWYGNFAFVRMWQGKALFVSVCAPLIAAYAIAFARSPSWWRLLLLSAAQVCAVGCTATALWAAPVISLVGLIAALPLRSRSLPLLLTGVLSSLYPLAVGWSFKDRAAQVIVPLLQTPAEAPTALTGPAAAAPARALIMVLGDSALAVSALGVILVGGFLAPPGLPRRLSAVASLVLAGFFLNPYLTAWIIENVTGPDLWRALWTLPLPVQMTLVLIAPLHLIQWRRAAYGTIATLVLAGGLLASVPATGGLTAANGVRLAAPRLKVEEVAYRWAGRLNDLAPAGTTVAGPPEVGVWIPTFHGHANPVAVRGYLGMSWRYLPDVDLQRRLQLGRDLAGLPRQRSPPARFRRSLEALSVQAVCLKWGASAPEHRAVLTEAGFEKRAEGEGYEIWVRRREP